MRDVPELKASTFRVRDQELERLPFEAEGLDAASARLPAGVYTTLRTYEGRKILRLDDHLERLKQSAWRLEPEMNIPLTRAELARALGRSLDLTRFPNSRLRITLAVPRGDLFVSVQPFAGLPPELFERGVAVAACPYVQHDTQAKATASITPLRGAQAALPAWAHEGLMIDSTGHILEGLSSNFFAIRGGVLYTADTGIIAGTIRAVVLGLAVGLLPIVWEPVHLSDLPEVTECFITSVSREVLPVVQVDRRTIGTGTPGVVTRELLQRFREYVRACADTV